MFNSFQKWAETNTGRFCVHKIMNLDPNTVRLWESEDVVDCREHRIILTQAGNYRFLPRG